MANKKSTTTKKRTTKKGSISLEKKRSQLKEYEDKINDLKMEMFKLQDKMAQLQIEIDEADKASRLKEIERKDYREVRYLDVFKRIADYLAGGDAYVNVGDVYGDEVYEGCSTYDEIDIEDDVVRIDISDESGDCVLEWKCVKSFLTAESSEDGYLLNIFKMLDYWHNKYARLDRCSAFFYEKFKSLQNIKPKDLSPNGIMKCLDLEGI